MELVHRTAWLPSGARDHGGAVTRQTRQCVQGSLLPQGLRAGTDRREADWEASREKVTLDFLGITVLNKESGLHSSETSKDPESIKGNRDRRECKQRPARMCRLCTSMQEGMGAGQDGLGLRCDSEGREKTASLPSGGAVKWSPLCPSHTGCSGRM